MDLAFLECFEDANVDERMNDVVVDHAKDDSDEDEGT